MPDAREPDRLFPPPAAAPPGPAGRTRVARSLRRYNRLLAGTDARGALHRLLIGPAGNFLINTPVFLLPERINLQGKHRVLDLQGGKASIARLLAARIPFERRPVVMDASLPALALARQASDAGRTVDLVGGRPVRLPFADASFDLVIAAHAFRRLSDDGLARCLIEVERVLRPGGVLTGWDYAPRSSRRLNRLHLRLLAFDPWPAHLRGFGALAHIAAEAGFAVIERPVLRPFLFPPIPHTALLAQKRVPGLDAPDGAPATTLG